MPVIECCNIVVGFLQCGSPCVLLRYYAVPSTNILTSGNIRLDLVPLEAHVTSVYICWRGKINVPYCNNTFTLELFQGSCIGQSTVLARRYFDIPLYTVGPLKFMRCYAPTCSGRCVYHQFLSQFDQTPLPMLWVFSYYLY